jgi:hypothetical protein
MPIVKNHEVLTEMNLALKGMIDDKVYNEYIYVHLFMCICTFIYQHMFIFTCMDTYSHNIYDL